MKIAIMFRAVEEIDGPGIASRNLIDKLIELDRENEYLILYMKPEFVGRYKQYRNVREILVNSKRKIIYDQIHVPRICKKEKVDLIFNPKFSVPLLTSIKSVMIQRGSEYWIYPEYYDRLDLLYVNIFLPLYCRKAVQIITLSDVLKRDLNKYINVPLEKMKTIYSAPAEIFKKIRDEEYLESIRKQLKLPKGKFVLAVTKPYSAVGSKKKEFYPRKNTHGVINSFISAKEQLDMDVKLVLLGINIRETLEEIGRDDLLARDDLVFPGYVSQELLPAVYNLASLLSFPSYYESFGIPLVEAMACGCPIITSNVGACPEIVADAAITVDPDDHNGLTQGIVDILSKNALAEELSQKGLKRAEEFVWEKSALELKKTFEECLR